MGVSMASEYRGLVAALLFATLLAGCDRDRPHHRPVKVLAVAWRDDLPIPKASIVPGDTFTTLVVRMPRADMATLADHSGAVSFDLGRCPKGKKQSIGRFFPARGYLRDQIVVQDDVEIAITAEAKQMLRGVAATGPEQVDIHFIIDRNYLWPPAYGCARFEAAHPFILGLYSPGYMGPSYRLPVHPSQRPDFEAAIAPPL